MSLTDVKDAQQDWIECVCVREIHIPQEQARPLTSENVAPFGATLGEPFNKWSHFGGQHVVVPASSFQPFSDAYKQGGWIVCALDR